MSIEGLVVPANDDAAVRRVQLPAGVIELLSATQEIVGGYVEAVRVPLARAVVWMDEDGKLKEKPANLRATELLAPVLGAGDFVVGDVLLLGVTGDGAECDVPEHLCAALTA